MRRLVSFWDRQCSFWFDRGVWGKRARGMAAQVDNLVWGWLCVVTQLAALERQS